MRQIFSVAFFYIFMADKEDTMEAYKVDMFLMQNGRYFNEDDLIFVQSILHRADDSWWNALLVMRFKSPVLALVLSLFWGTLGVDRFYVGNVGLGILKLLTAGFGGIWTIIDWFLIMRVARTANYRTLEEYVD